jgi:hypothetical protein
MYRNIDVMTEMRKLGESKPVHALAGAGALASQALRELPWRLVRWTRDNPPHSLPARTHGYVQTAQSRTQGYVQTAQARANEAAQTVRAKAASHYDALAARGEKAMNGHATPAKSAPAKSTTATETKAALNGKPKGKSPSSRSTTSH